MFTEVIIINAQNCPSKFSVCTTNPNHWHKQKQKSFRWHQRGWADSVLSVTIWYLMRCLFRELWPELQLTRYSALSALCYKTRVGYRPTERSEGKGRGGRGLRDIAMTRLSMPHAAGCPQQWFTTKYCIDGDGDAAVARANRETQDSWTSTQFTICAKIHCDAALPSEDNEIIYENKFVLYLFFRRTSTLKQNSPQDILNS